MSIDLGAILDTAGAVVGSVLDTSGTVVDILRDAHLYDDATIDPVTLAIVDPTPETVVESDVPALIAAAGATTRAFAVLTQQTAADYVVKIPASVTDVREKDVIVASACRDEALIGVRLRVDSIEGSGAGLMRSLSCHVDVTPS